VFSGSQGPCPVQQEVNEKNLSLKIWDAYRPYSVIEKMWGMIKDKRYVADPKKGSGHNRGIAVDLTIIDRTTGIELDISTILQILLTKISKIYRREF